MPSRSSTTVYSYRFAILRTILKLAGLGWGEDGPEHRLHHVLVALRHRRGQVPGEVDPAALLPGLDTRPSGARPACWSEMTSCPPRRPPWLSDRGSRAKPPVLGVADIQAEDLPGRRQRGPWWPRPRPLT